MLINFCEVMCLEEEMEVGFCWGRVEVRWKLRKECRFFRRGEKFFIRKREVFLNKFG